VLDIATGRSALISNDAGASNPQWLGDGDQLVWLKEKDNGNTSFIVGDAGQVGSTYMAGTVPGPVSDLKLTTIEPGKIGFAVSGKANPDGSLYNPKDAKKPVSSGKYYTSLFVRHWDKYIEPQKNALWYGLLQIVPSGGTASMSTKYSVSGLTNLMAVTGLDGVEAPISPFGGTDNFDISPSAIVFVAKDPDLNPATHTACVCYYCPMFSWTDISIRREAKICRLTALEGAMTSPVLSSDGSSIVFLAMKTDGYESDKNRIVYVPNPWGGEMIEVFQTSDGEGQWDLSPSAVSWSQDNKSLFLQVEEKGRGVLYQLPLENIDRATPKSLRKLTHSGYVTAVVPAAANSRKLFISSSNLVESSVYTILDPSSPDEAAIVSSSSRGGASLGLSRSQIDEFWYRGANDHPVHAWVVKPSKFNPDEKYPLAFLIHGGPQGAWGRSMEHALESGHLCRARLRRSDAQPDG
jgi:pre-mRNA-splicing helicase BRR2